MPDTFTVFPAANRQPNTEYISAVYNVPADSVDRTIQFTLTALDLIEEPDTTIIHWRIERNDGSGWMLVMRSSTGGLNGGIPPKPVGVFGLNINSIRGQSVRGVIVFESAADRRKRFGIDGATF